MTTKEAIKEAFIKSLPIIGSYIFMSIAYGIMMEKSGFKWWWSFLASLSIYTGALQFVLVTMLSGGASIITVAFTTLFMNSRQFFYGLTFVEEFKKMKKKMLYMINTLTDETYAVNCSMLFAVGADKFMLPSLVVVSGILLGLRNKIEGKDEAYD